MTTNRKMRFSRAGSWAASTLILCVWWTVAGGAALDPEPADKPTPSATGSFLKELREGFDARYNILMFGTIQDPVNSGVNPNNVNALATYETEMDLRPDFFLNFRRLELMVKPRLDLAWQKIKGEKKGSRTTSKLFVNEGYFRFRFMDELFASYGLENLQWGPSYLLSPSNPFNPANGQNNPIREVPGMEYARAVWIPTPKWAVSYIVNTGQGQNDLITDFENTYALKIDYTGEKKYFSLIPFHRQNVETGTGFFGGWTVSDAFLLHAEGLISTDRTNFRILVGGSYTFEAGPTLILEYFYKKNGCTLDPIDECFVPALGSDADPADVLLRQHYTLLQYTQTNIWDVLNVTMRWIHNFDDNSDNRFIGIFEYEFADYATLFSVNTINSGSGATESGALVQYQFIAGLRLAF